MNDKLYLMIPQHKYFSFTSTPFLYEQVYTSQTKN